MEEVRIFYVYVDGELKQLRAKWIFPPNDAIVNMVSEKEMIESLVAEIRFELNGGSYENTPNVD